MGVYSLHACAFRSEQSHTQLLSTINLPGEITRIPEREYQKLTGVNRKLPRLEKIKVFEKTFSFCIQVEATQ